MPKDYYGRNDYSDEESNSRSRDKFRRERSPEKDDFGRDKRRRKTSASPEERERRPKRNRSASKDGTDSAEPGDRYIPNYTRDGYNPPPRYSRGEHFSGNRFENHGGYSDFRGQSRRREDGYMDMDGQEPMYGGPDMPSNWSSADRLEDPMKLDYMISFKQYCEHLRNVDRASHRYKRYTDEELQSRYGVYREEYIAKQLTTFFEGHKDQAWFLEKYHPETSKPRQEEARSLRKSLYAKFVLDLAAGKYDHTTCDEAQAKKESALTSGAKATAEDDGSDEALVNTEEEESDASKEKQETMLYLRAVLPQVARDTILQRCNKIEGFEMLSLSEPHPLKDLQRIGWVKFSPGTDLQEALKAITEPSTDDFQVTTVPHRPTRARYTHEIANTDTRILADHVLCAALAKVCDQALSGPGDLEADVVVYDGASLLEARLRDVILPTMDVKNEDGDQEEGALAPAKAATERRSLDLFIEYLRKVHLFCFYCGGDSDNAEEFNRKCSKHYRNPDNRLPANPSKGAIWVKNLEQKINQRIKTPVDDELVKLGGKSLEKASLKFLQSKTQQDEPTKWRCKICTKPFRGEEFVHKHIRTKHPDEVKEIENEISLFNNYILDPNHINPSAQQQQAPQSMPTGFGFGGPGMFGPMAPISFMPGAHPMGAPFMNPGISPIPQFPPGFIPPSFSATAAMAGTPMDQIPRIGFDFGKRRGSKEEAEKPRIGKTDPTPAMPRPASLMLDPRSRMSDPRQVKSYVDLDAPAEGDIDAKYNLW